MSVSFEYAQAVLDMWKSKLFFLPKGPSHHVKLHAHVLVPKTLLVINMMIVSSDFTAYVFDINDRLNLSSGFSHCLLWFSGASPSKCHSFEVYQNGGSFR